MVPTLTQSTESRPAWLRYLLQVGPPVLIVVVALAAYANAWPNTLVHDDKFYRGSERFTELSNIPRYFTENAWASSGVSSQLYRPLLLASITMDARVHGDWVAGYHITNILLHTLVAVLLYGFLLQLLRLSNGQSGPDTHFALLAALIFAVHPVYTETVNSIFNRSEILVALGGLAGLIWFLRYLNIKPARAWIGLGLAYLGALFCKESAVILPGLAVILVLIFTPGGGWARVQKCLPVFWLLVPLALYFGLRTEALSPVELAGAAEVSGVTSVAADDMMLDKFKAPGATNVPDVDVMLDRFQIPDWARMMQLAGLWFDSLKIMVWPIPLKLKHPGISQSAQIAGLALHFALILLALHQIKHQRYWLFMGLAFFYIATLPASRIIGDPNMVPHVTERYLYFPSVGLAILLAFGFRSLARRTDILWVASVVVLTVIVLTPVTWARNAVWASEIQLYENEYRNGNDTTTILVWLTATYLKGSEFQKVGEICDRHVSVQKRSGKLSTHCATAYSQSGRLVEAERAYLFGVRDKYIRAIAHANLGRFYLRQDRWSDAKIHFEKAVEAEKLPASRAYRKGHMLVRLYPSDRQKLLEAKAHFEHALQLQPDFMPARQWLTRVDRALGLP